MATYKFVPGIWISFELNGKQCIGRTLFIENEEIVATVTSKGEIGHLPFSNIDRPTKINFLNGKKSDQTETEMLNKLGINKENLSNDKGSVDDEKFNPHQTNLPYVEKIGVFLDSFGIILSLN